MRRPLPALVSLLALLLLTALVWWRVLHRGGGSDSAKSCPTPTTSASTPTTPALAAPSTITLSVLNATNRSGIAAKARSTLVADGFKVPGIAANDKTFLGKIPGVAEIRYGPTGQKGAAVLAYYLPGAKLVRTTDKTATVVVSLGAKYKAVATQAAVNAAVKRANLHIAPSSPTVPASGASGSGASSGSTATC
jgi:hypothetical protein